MKTTIRLSGPADLLAVLPYQLGFHPRDCLVVVSLRGTRMGLVQRIDLPPPEHVGDAVAAMMAPLLRDSPRSVFLVGFEESEGESRTMLDEMAAACRANGVKVDDRVVVRGGRWFDLDCHQRCCPPEGLELPPPSEVPAVAEFVGRGICPLPDRSSLADLLEPSRPLLSRAVSLLADEWLELRLEAIAADKLEWIGADDPRATEPHPQGADHRETELLTRETEPDIRETEPHSAETELSGFRANELAVWARVLCDDDAELVAAMPPQDLAILAVSLTDVDLRDGLIAWLCPGTLSHELIDPGLFLQMSRTLSPPRCLDGDLGDVEQVMSGQRTARRLGEVCAALPDVWAVSALTVFASFTWWRGDGALTRIALDRALREDPNYRLALLLERMVDLGIRHERASA